MSEGDLNKDFVKILFLSHKCRSVKRVHRESFGRTTVDRLMSMSGFPIKNAPYRDLDNFDIDVQV